MKLAKVALVCGILGLVMPGAAVHAAAIKVEQAAIEISVHEGLVTVNARNATALEVLQAIAHVTGLRATIAGELNASATAWSFANLPLLEALRNVAKGCDLMLAYEASARDGADQRPSWLWVYGRGVTSGQGTLSPPTLLPPVGRADPASGIEAGRTLAVTDERRAVAVLGQKLKQGEDAAARLEAVAALEAIAGERAARALEGGLGDAETAVRVQVIAALERIGSHDVIATLGQALFGDRDPEVRLAAVQAIARHRSEAARAFLEAAGRDIDSKVREAASRALARAR